MNPLEKFRKKFSLTETISDYNKSKKDVTSVSDRKKINPLILSLSFKINKRSQMESQKKHEIFFYPFNI